MAGVKLLSDESLILLNFKAADKQEVITELGKRAEAKGYINSSFIPRLLAREENFPTGLPFAYPIAIPHIDGDCLHPFLAVAVLDEPVHFEDMGGTTEGGLDVRLVFLFGITDPQDQIQVLKNFMAAFSAKENLEALLNIDSVDTALKMLKSLLGDSFEVPGLE
jgi:PTS system galactitol-specific IIA component